MVTLHSRSEVGFPPSQAPRQDPAGVELVVIHWNGPALGQLTTLQESIDAWQGIRRFNVQQRGWRDVAYTLAVCPATGTLLAGRMWHGQPAAHAPHNHGSYAIFALIGEGDPVKDALRDGIRTAIQLAMRHAPIVKVMPHADVPQNSTVCPGPELGILARGIGRQPDKLGSQQATQSDSETAAEESEEDMVDVIKANGEVYLHHAPWITGPMTHGDYYLNLARSGGNPQYRGPYEWDEDRLERHPRPEAPKSST